jgi:hypothetical protein
MAIDGQIRGAFLVLCGVVRARVPHGVCHATCRVFGPERASITLSASNNASVLVVFSMLALAQKLYCARGDRSASSTGAEFLITARLILHCQEEINSTSGTSDTAILSCNQLR